MKNKPKFEKSRLRLIHQYYNYTGFYKFIGNTLKQSAPYLISIVGILYIIDYFIDINEILETITRILPVYGVLGFFFVSETLLGLIPPEIFIAWSGKMQQPWFYLSTLAILSYAGGLLAYLMGCYITKIPYVQNYFEIKMKKQLKNSRKWGGFLIVVGALLPLPFSISCMAAGIIAFPFRSVLIYGSLRLLRFAIYGFIIFNAL